MKRRNRHRALKILAQQKDQAVPGVIEAMQACATLPRWMHDKAYDQELNARAFAEADAWARSSEGTSYPAVRV